MLGLPPFFLEYFVSEITSCRVAVRRHPVDRAGDRRHRDGVHHRARHVHHHGCRRLLRAAAPG